MSDTADKILKDCEHTVPVKVPCHSCVEMHLEMFAISIQEKYRATLAERWDRLQLERDSFRRDAEKAANLTLTVARQRDEALKDTEIVRAELDAAKKEIVDLKVELRAERAMRLDRVTS